MDPRLCQGRRKLKAPFEAEGECKGRPAEAAGLRQLKGLAGHRDREGSETWRLSLIQCCSRRLEVDVVLCTWAQGLGRATGAGTRGRKTRQALGRELFVFANEAVVGLLKRAVSGTPSRLDFASCDGRCQNRGRNSVREGKKSPDLGGLTD